MHTTLTEHARCLYGDEHRPTPECGAEHSLHYFVEELTFAGADEVLAMLRELSPQLVDGYLPVWVRNLAYRLVLLQRPDEPDLMREAAQSLWLHGPDWDAIAEELTSRADALEAARAGEPTTRADAPETARAGELMRGADAPEAARAGE